MLPSCCAGFVTSLIPGDDNPVTTMGRRDAGPEVLESCENQKVRLDLRPRVATFHDICRIEDTPQFVQQGRRGKRLVEQLT